MYDTLSDLCPPEYAVASHQRDGSVGFVREDTLHTVPAQSLNQGTPVLGKVIGVVARSIDVTEFGTIQQLKFVADFRGKALVLGWLARLFSPLPL